MDIDLKELKIKLESVKESIEKDDTDFIGLILKQFEQELHNMNMKEKIVSKNYENNYSEDFEMQEKISLSDYKEYERICSEHFGADN